MSIDFTAIQLMLFFLQLFPEQSGRFFEITALVSIVKDSEAQHADSQFALTEIELK